MEVRYLPYQPHCFSFGGFDLQMIHTLDAVKEAGVKAIKLNPWDRDNAFDIIHLWGLDIANYRNIVFAKKDKKKIVMTTLSGYVGGMKEDLKWKVRNRLRSYAFYREMTSKIDSLVLLNEGQAEFAVKYWRVAESIISIIPAIVQENYFRQQETNRTAFCDAFGVKDFILTTGNVGVRKNQLKLAEACAKINKNLVIIGNALPGEEKYGKQLDDFANNNPCITWIKELKNNSTLLISAYNECDAFALVSREEQQPISPLEAAVRGKPVLLGNSSYARQKYFTNTCLVDIEDAGKIADAITGIGKSPQTYIIPPHYLNSFRAKEVGEQYARLYRSILS